MSSARCCAYSLLFHINSFSTKTLKNAGFQGSCHLPLCRTGMMGQDHTRDPILTPLLWAVGVAQQEQAGSGPR